MMAPVYLKRVSKKRDQPIKDTRGFRAKPLIIAQSLFPASTFFPGISISLQICPHPDREGRRTDWACPRWPARSPRRWTDRKSTRLNSSHTVISYAVFCLKKKKNE